MSNLHNFDENKINNNMKKICSIENIYDNKIDTKLISRSSLLSLPDKLSTTTVDSMKITVNNVEKSCFSWPSTSSSSSSSLSVSNENLNILIHDDNINNNKCNTNLNINNNFIHSKTNSIEQIKQNNLNNNNRNKFININRNILQIQHSTTDENDNDDIRNEFIQFNDHYSQRQQQRQSIKNSLSSLVNNDCSVFNLLRAHVPILDWLPKYSLKSYLLPDIIAGITISILHIPQGIAYSMLAGLDPVHGLYVSFFPVIIYTLLGTSPHISIGTFAIASIMLNNIATKMGAISNGKMINQINDTVISQTINDSMTVETNNLISENLSMLNVNKIPTTLEVLTSVCILCGIIQIAMALLRLGSLSLILSEQLVSAFSTAVAFHVATSQLSSIFGFTNLTLAKSGPLKLIKTWIILLKNYDMININCLIFSMLSIIILILSKELLEPKLKKFTSFPLPIDLILVITSILLSWIFDFNQQFKIQVVQNVPTGLPKPTIPRFDLMPNIFFDSLVLSIICFAVSLSLAKIFAKKHGQQIRPNQELFALGAANIFSSFFMAYPCSAALSRSTLQEKIGGKTQIAGLVSSTIILTVLLFLAPFLYHLPKFTLSCIVLVALKSMFLQITDVKIFWSISRLDGIAWIITFISVIVLDIDYGLIIGIVSAILVILIKLAFPRISVLANLVSTEIYLEKDYYNNLIEYDGIKIYRFYSPLFYLNVDMFKEKIYESINDNHNDDLQLFILDFSGMPFIDKTGIDILIELIKQLQMKKIFSCITNCPQHILITLKNVKFFQQIQHNKYDCKLYPTIHDAVINNYW